VAAVADAVIVGSAIVGRVEALKATPAAIPDAVGGFLAELRQAIDAANDGAGAGAVSQ
jgi:tryptophan synthase alpha chain